MKHLFFFLISWLPLAAAAQQLTGQVTEETTRTPVVGATVLLSDGQVVATNEAGFFVFRKPPTAPARLRVSAIGYATFLQPLENGVENSLLNISLKKAEIQLQEVEVRSDRPARQQVLSDIDISLRPLQNAQEVLRMVPGLFIGQHAGGGKAEQIFLRGFDIDHGTDIRITADGLPVNMVSHAHGQGYADLHFLIPELIENVAYGKGPYDADKGNFTTAGWVNFRTRDVLDRSFARAEAGQFNTWRGVGAVNLLSNPGGPSAYVAAEYNYSDSFFDAPQHFKRLNVLGKYRLPLSNRTTLTAMVSTFWSRWNHSGQIPDRAVAGGLISHFGAIDANEGGLTSRHNASLSLLSQRPGGGLWQQQLFASQYNFDLFSNFTFFLNDPLNGDQIRQRESRLLWGYNGSYTHTGTLAGRRLATTTGLQYRHDRTRGTELSHTLNRYTLLDRLQYGNIGETNAGLYAEADWQPGPRWTLNAGIRYDYFHNRYLNRLDSTDRRASAGLVSPKASLYFTVNPKLRLALRLGRGFHANDTRVVVPRQGRDILPAAYGSDVVLDFKPAPRLYLHLAGWYLWLAQECVYVGDEGVVEPGGRTRRQGIDLGLRYQLLPRLFLDTDLTLTRPQALDAERGENYLPLAPLFTASGGLSLQPGKRWSGSLRYRWLGDRPASEDNSIVARGYFISDLQANYDLRRMRLGLSVNNLFNTLWKETQFATESRLKNETRPVEEIHFTAGSPFFARLMLTYQW